jgi:hypothetical protein
MHYEEDERHVTASYVNELQLCTTSYNPAFAERTCGFPNPPREHHLSSQLDSLCIFLDLFGNSVLQCQHLGYISQFVRPGHGPVRG